MGVLPLMAVKIVKISPEATGRKLHSSCACCCKDWGKRHFFFSVDKMACRAEIDDWINEIKLLPGIHVFTLSTLLPRTQTQESPPPFTACLFITSYTCRHNPKPYHTGSFRRLL